MFYDLANFPGWFLSALLVGAVVGWMTYSAAPRGDWFEGWLKWATIAFGVGVFVALLRLLPGRVGLWLELALFLTFFYIVGCFLGGWLKTVFASEGASAPAVAAPKPSADPFAPVPDSYPGVRPAALAAAGGGDDLTKIAGIGALDQKTLNDIGVSRFGQIAGWSAANVAWVEHHIAAPGRVGGEGWIASAAALAATPLAVASAASVKPSVAAAAPARIMADPATTSRQDAGPVAGQSGEQAIAEAAAAAQAEAARQAAEAAAKVEADRASAANAPVSAEGATAVGAGSDLARAAADAAAKADADRRAAEATAKADAERQAMEAAAKADAQRRVAIAAEAIKAEADAKRAAADVAPMAGADQQAAEAPAHPGDKPASLAGPDGAPDNLKLIKGIGPKNEAVLHGLGVYHFRQIADWTPENAVWTGHHMAFPGRIEREHWIPQAKLLAAGIDTDHSAAVKSGAITIDDTADAPLSDSDAAKLGSSLPVVAAEVEGEDAHSGARPLGLAVARGGVPDDLKLIKGIGKQNEARLHGLGIWHFDQIAAWSHDNVHWVGSYLAFPGRIDRENWIAQAKELAAGHTTEFAKRVEAGQVKSSLDEGTQGQGNVEKVEPRRS